MKISKRLVHSSIAVLTVAFAGHAVAEVVVPMETDTALTLGSGVMRGVKPEILPGCFDFTKDFPDPKVIGNYASDVKIVSSVEELRRARRKSGSASASYGGVKAAIEGWSNTESSQEKASLYAVIEARFTGPRTLMVIGEAKPQVAELLKSGTPLQIRKRCGTHIATTEHHGQIIRVVINLTQESRLIKEEVAARFSIKGSYGAFKAKASGSYAESMTNLAKQKNLDVHAEGTGQPPSTEVILGLLQTNAGDLKAVADALGQIIASANTGKLEAQAITGYTIQPLSQYVEKADFTDDAEVVLNAENQLRDYLDMLGAQINQENRQLGIVGLAESEKATIASELVRDRKLHAELRKDLDTCHNVEPGSEAACDALAPKWMQRLTNMRGTTAKIALEKDNNAGIKKALLTLNSRYRGAGYLVASIDGVNYSLDPVKYSQGTTSYEWFAKIETAGPTTAPPSPPSPPTAPAVGVTSPYGPYFATPRLKSELPLSATLAAILNFARLEGNSEFREIQFGCYGAVTYKATHTDFISFDGLRSETNSPDSICSGYAPFQFPAPQALQLLPPSPGDSGTLKVADVFGLMPQGLAPNRVRFPKAPVSLMLVVVDEFGFQTTHLLDSDVGKLFGVAPTR